MQVLFWSYHRSDFVNTIDYEYYFKVDGNVAVSINFIYAGGERHFLFLSNVLHKIS